jgi:hypothetical protein
MMAPLQLDAFTERIKDLLSSRYEQVATEWRSAIGPEIYSPRVDIAVGPFSLIDGRSEARAYDALCRNSLDLLYQLIEHHRSNAHDERGADYIFESLVSFNPNSRCFIAIEIENAVTRKHLLGGALNASVLGRIALAVGGNPRSHNAFLRLRKYFEFLTSVGKNSFNADNLLVITPEQLYQSVKAFSAVETARKSAAPVDRTGNGKPNSLRPESK